MYKLSVFEPMDGANVNTAKKYITKLFLARESLVSDIPTGGGNIDNLFFTVWQIVF
jgi:hypothetical protein